MQRGNVFEELPDALAGEVFEDILHARTVRIERIVSRGQSTAPGEWYDQQQHEWVMLLQGSARLVLEVPPGAAGAVSLQEVALHAGDYLNIPAGQRHRVSWTDPDQQTVWLAVFYC